MPTYERTQRRLWFAGGLVLTGLILLLLPWSRFFPGAGSSDDVSDVGSSPAGNALGETGTGQAEESWPTLSELEQVSWAPQPCVYFLEHLRAQLREETREIPESAISEAAALSLRNDGAETNRKILGALGRLPETDDEVDWNATFSRFIGGDPATLNPLFSTSRYDSWLEDLLFVGPVQFDWNLIPYGDLNVIERWETSEDHRMDRVILRDDLRWSDGTRVTARDVEFSFKLFSDSAIGVQSRRSLVDGLRGVKAYDDRTVVYFQKDVLATNWLHIAWPILSQLAFEKALQTDPTLETSTLSQNPVTCGPYRLVEWRRNEELVLERNENWYRGEGGKRIRAKPFFQRIRFRVLPQNATRYLAFLGGTIDDTQLTSTQWVDQAEQDEFCRDNVKVRGDEWTYAFIGWNAKSVPPNPFFDDALVRRAMSLALDHHFLLQQLFHGIYRPGAGIFHPDSWMAAQGLVRYRQDLDQAEKLLEEAGWTDSDGDGVLDKLVDENRVPFRFVLSCPNAGNGPVVAEQLKSDLERIGVECDIQLIEWLTFQSLVQEHKAQAFLMSMGTGVDPDTARNLWHCDAIQNGRNQVGFCDSRVDQLLDRGRREMDRAERARIYAEVDRIIYEAQPITNILYQSTLWAFSKSLRGYRHSPKGFYGYAPGFYSIWKKKD